MDGVPYKFCHRVLSLLPEEFAKNSIGEFQDFNTLWKSAAEAYQQKLKIYGVWVVEDLLNNLYYRLYNLTTQANISFELMLKENPDYVRIRDFTFEARQVNRTRIITKVSHDTLLDKFLPFCIKQFCNVVSCNLESPLEETVLTDILPLFSPLPQLCQLTLVIHQTEILTFALEKLKTTENLDLTLQGRLWPKSIENAIVDSIRARHLKQLRMEESNLNMTKEFIHEIVRIYVQSNGNFKIQIFGKGDLKISDVCYATVNVPAVSSYNFIKWSLPDAPVILTFRKVLSELNIFTSAVKK
ncbi:hypothetical protein L596_001646 [Steinernema carpocapsae]|uniref:Uncharacterized protein n=1 Tax=Steinernema carpocapsae TaxID=34508 RepID=A0A4U8UM25_STECR|nr:hypothetical protein L596_001646 [Steinernema carpocapsae]